MQIPLLFCWVKWKKGEKERKAVRGRRWSLERKKMDPIRSEQLYMTVRRGIL